MELEFLFLILAILMGSYIGIFGFLRSVNEWYYVSKLREKRHFLPPGDMGWPLVGNMQSFLRAFKSSDPDTFIHSLVKRYGRTGMYKTHLFWSPSVIVCSPETCRQVLLDDEQFGEGYVVSTKRLFGNSKTIRSLSNEEHTRLFKLTATPIKGHKALAMYIENIEEIVINSLDEWTSTHRPIDFLSEMRKVTFKIIAHIFLGSTADSVIGSMEKHYTDLFYGLKSVAINIPGFAFHRALKARNKLVEILEMVLNEKKAMRGSTDQQEGKRGLIDLLMEVEDDQNSIKLENEDIIELLLIFLAAGHESTAHATMWAIIYLNQHPEVLQKAKEEQEKIIKRRPPTQKILSLEEIRQMEYLAKVINETLRKTSISLSIFRKAKKDINIQGFIIPKGWKVLVWGRGVHMDPENFPDPKMFDPSRWDNYVAKSGAFIPFGAGSRFCPGADLAKLEMSIFLHYFLLNYKLEQLNPGCPVLYLPFPRPSDNCLAKVIRLK